jgi:hypothetical protein
MGHSMLCPYEDGREAEGWNQEMLHVKMASIKTNQGKSTQSGGSCHCWRNCWPPGLKPGLAIMIFYAAHKCTAPLTEVRGFHRLRRRVARKEKVVVRFEAK